MSAQLALFAGVTDDMRDQLVADLRPIYARIQGRGWVVSCDLAGARSRVNNQHISRWIGAGMSRSEAANECQRINWELARQMREAE